MQTSSSKLLETNVSLLVFQGIDYSEKTLWSRILPFRWLWLDTATLMLDTVKSSCAMKKSAMHTKHIHHERKL